MTIEELKNKDDYSFSCCMTKEEYSEVEDGDVWDDWGCADLWLGDMGVEYNYCVDKSTDETVNASAIYLEEIDEESGYVETDTSTFIHYEIDFNNENWEEELENAMCKALIKFFEL